MSHDPKNDEKKNPPTKLPELQPAQEVAESDLEDIAAGCAVLSCLADSCNGTSITGTKTKAFA